MADMPEHVVKTITRHEWIIGDEYATESIARTLEDGLYFAKQDMVSLGLQTTSDDCYSWRAGDGGRIIIFVDKED